MTSLLRQLVAGPRARHPEAKLDLCYVTDDIIVTSGPAMSYPSRAYRNPLPKLLSFLTARHSEDWCIFEFRAEGTGYDDKAVQGRIRHFPWPDHHPPPFAVVPAVMESMAMWMGEEPGRERLPPVENGDGTVGHVGLPTEKGEKGEKGERKRVAILHCKAGKGRSGTVACSYLITARGWSVEDALARFTERRMRPGWGDGISIKSQRRWITYVDRWASTGRKYSEKKVKIVEVRLWGRRDGARVLIRGYVNEGKKIKVMYAWKDTDGEEISIPEEENMSKADEEELEEKFDESSPTLKQEDIKSPPPSKSPPSKSSSVSRSKSPSKDSDSLPSGTSTPKSTSSLKLPASLTNPPPATITILRPTEPLILGTQDVNVEVERRNRTSYGIPSVVTSTAHSWFNAYFEGKGPEQQGNPERTGIYTVEWDAMDGLKGSSRRGVRAVERVAVVWEILEDEVAEKEEQIAEEKRQEKRDKPEDEAVGGEALGHKKDEGDIVEGDPALESDTEEGLQTYGVKKGEKV